MAVRRETSSQTSNAKVSMKAKHKPKVAVETPKDGMRTESDINALGSVARMPHRELYVKPEIVISINVKAIKHTADDITAFLTLLLYLAANSAPKQKNRRVNALTAIIISIA